MIKGTKLKAGDRVRSYDFPGNKTSYVEGTVLKVGRWDQCPGDCDHVHISVDKRVWSGKEDSINSGSLLVFPPVDNYFPNFEKVEEPKPEASESLTRAEIEKESKELLTRFLYPKDISWYEELEERLGDEAAEDIEQRVYEIIEKISTRYSLPDTETAYANEEE